MYKYAVSLFFRKSSEYGNSERMILKIVDADCEDMAFAKAYRLAKVDFPHFDLVYDLVVKI